MVNGLSRRDTAVPCGAVPHLGSRSLLPCRDLGQSVINLPLVIQVLCKISQFKPQSFKQTVGQTTFKDQMWPVGCLLATPGLNSAWIWSYFSSHYSQYYSLVYHQANPSLPLSLLHTPCLQVPLYAMFICKT